MKIVGRVASVVKQTRPSDWVWTAWLLGTIGSFAVLEARAIRTREFDTLSAFYWRTARGWPPINIVYGTVFGFLAAHFGWPNEGLDDAGDVG